MTSLFSTNDFNPHSATKIVPNVTIAMWISSLIFLVNLIGILNGNELDEDVLSTESKHDNSPNPTVFPISYKCTSPHSEADLAGRCPSGKDIFKTCMGR